MENLNDRLNVIEEMLGIYNKDKIIIEDNNLIHGRIAGSLKKGDYILIKNKPCKISAKSTCK